MAEHAGATSAAADPMPMGYAALRVLGEGGFGKVYLARRIADRREVALKLASASRGSAKSLRREADALAAIGGDAAPEFVESGLLPDGSPWLAMGVVPGVPWPGDLSSTSAIVGSLRRFDAFLLALARVHSAGFVHGDLKPQNILVDGDRVALIDFGLARAAASEDDEHEEEDEDVVGTALYMSPEQCTTGVRIDARSDVYAAGVLLYGVLAGVLPFQGSAAQVRESHRSCRPKSLLGAGVPVELDDLLMAVLAKAPAERPDSATGFRTALADILARVGPFTVAGPSPAMALGSTKPSKQSIGLLWFRSDAAAAGLQHVVHDGGGQIIHARAGEFVAAYTRSGNEHPIRAALASGNILLRRGLAERVLIDAATAAVQRRPDGRERIAGVALPGIRDPYPSLPAGLLATVQAAKNLSELEYVDVEGRSDLVALPLAEDGFDVSRLGEPVVPLFGRDAELEAVSQQLATLGGRPGLATLTGDRGSGKTRFAQALVESFADRGNAITLAVLRVSAPSTTRREPAPRQLLRSLLPLPSEAPLDPRGSLAGHLGETSEEVLLGLRLAMGWIDEADPEIRRLRVAPGALRSLQARALGEVLLRRARTRPLRLIVDDAQHLDDATLDALEYATRADIDAPIWIGVLARTGFDATRTAWGAHARSHVRRELAPLDPSAAGNLVRHILHEASNLSETVIDQLVARTRGMPIVIVELLRALRRDGLIRPRERGSGLVIDTDALDDNAEVPIVQWLAERELDGLAPALRAHASLASVLGPSFGADQVAKMVRELERGGETPPSELDPAVGLKRLRRAGVLVEDEAGRFEFRHEPLRERAYALLADDVRRVCHHAAYRATAADVAVDDEARLVHLAFHAAGANLREEAIEHRLALAQLAVDRHEYVLANTSFKRALEQLDPADVRHVRLLHGLGLTRFRMGRHEDALRDLREAIGWAERRNDHGVLFELLLDTATVLDWIDERQTSADLVERAHAVAARLPSDDLVRARLRLGRGRSQFRFGEWTSALQSCSEAALAAEAVGEAGYETRVIALLLAGPLAAVSGDETRGLAIFDELLALCRAHGDLIHLAAAHANRAFVWLASGRVDELVADIRQSIEISRRVGFPAQEIRALFNLAEIMFHLDRCNEAIDLARQSIDLALAVEGVAYKVVLTRLLLARCYWLAGDPSRARTELEQIERTQSQRRAEMGLDANLMPNETILQRMLWLVLDDGNDPAWESLFADAERFEEIVEVLEFASQAAARAGREVRAVELLDRAIAQLEAFPTAPNRDRVRARRRAVRSPLG